jgi:hypothetical protein
MTFPHDISDLYLAPVTLAIDAALENWTASSADEVSFDVALRTNSDPKTPGERSAALLEALAQPEMHGWVVSLDSRGVVLAHDEHRITLGVPDGVRSYLSA